MTIIDRSRVASPFFLDWDGVNDWDADNKPLLRNGAKGTHTRAYVARVTDRNGIQRPVGHGQPAIDHWLNPATSLWEPAGVLLEDVDESKVKRSCDFAHADWVKTNVTVAANNAIAPDGTLTADKLTATAGNATVIQDAGTLSSNLMLGGFHLRRATGSGTIQITLDGGSTWTTVVLTTSWLRLEKSQTLANPDIGIRIVTSGDAIYAWNGMMTVGSTTWTNAKLTSDIVTDTAAVTRAAADLTLPFHRLPTGGAFTLLVEWRNLGTAQRNAEWAGVFSVGGVGAGSCAVRSDTGNTLRAVYHGAALESGGTIAGPAIGDWVRTRLVVNADGSTVHGQSIKQSTTWAAEVTANSAATAPAAAFVAPEIKLNHYPAGLRGTAVYRLVRGANGVRSLAEMLSGVFA